MEDRVRHELNGKKPSEIQDLLLDNCKATSISGLTDEFRALTTLSMINVGLTTLEGMPKLPALRTIDLSDNKLAGGLEKLVECCPRLYHLNLCANKIEELKALEPLKDLKELAALDLFDCKVTEGPEYRKEVFEMLPQIKFLDGFDQNDEEADLSEEDDGVEDVDAEEEESAGEEFDSNDEEELAYLNSYKAVQDEDESEDYLEKPQEANATMEKIAARENGGEKKNGASAPNAEPVVAKVIAAEETNNNTNSRKRKLEEASAVSEKLEGEPEAKV